MDRIHLDVLVSLVEFNTASDTRKVLGAGERIANRLPVFSTALDHIGDQHDLIVGMRVDVRGVCVVFRLEGADEIANGRSLVGRIELYNADIAESCLSGFLFEAERKPDGAQLNCLPAAPFCHAGLCECLGDF